MHAVINNDLEDSINKIIEKGLSRNRPKPFVYASLDVFFENEKKVHSNSSNEAKFQKALTIDAYRYIILFKIDIINHTEYRFVVNTRKESLE